MFYPHYRAILSLREYILIAQDSYHIERFARQSDTTWVLSEAISREDTIDLATIECILRLEEVYEKVTFPLDEAEEGRTEFENEPEDA